MSIPQLVFAGNNSKEKDIGPRRGRKKWAGRTEVRVWQYNLAEKWEPGPMPQGLFTTFYDGKNPGDEREGRGVRQL